MKANNLEVKTIIKSGQWEFFKIRMQGKISGIANGNNLGNKNWKIGKFEYTWGKNTKTRRKTENKERQQ